MEYCSKPEMNPPGTFHKARLFGYIRQNSTFLWIEGKGEYFLQSNISIVVYITYFTKVFSPGVNNLDLKVTVQIIAHI